MIIILPAIRPSIPSIKLILFIITEPRNKIIIIKIKLDSINLLTNKLVFWVKNNVKNKIVDIWKTYLINLDKLNLSSTMPTKANGNDNKGK